MGYYLFLIDATAYSMPMQSIQFRIPDHAYVISSDKIKTARMPAGEYRLFLGKSTVFPLELTISDLFGAHIQLFVNDPSALMNQVIETDYVINKRANPLVIYHLPKLCPRVQLHPSKILNTDSKLIYNGALDFANHRPTIQLFDPDAKNNAVQRSLLDHFDKRNILTIKYIKISYDYEDNTILDYEGPHPITGKKHMVYEGEGGFYANFHYAIIPYDKRIKNLGRQELLNLAQGKLAYINRNDLKPDLRVHSFLPGPYVSNSKIYSLCEWGDTAFQAKVQEMYYRDIHIWDWDLKDNQKLPIDHLIMIVWEGDEEDWLIQKGLLDPYYLTDDVVGVFEIKRQDSLKPLKLINQAGNFEFVIETINF